MPKRKHVNKKKVEPRSDANQGILDHNKEKERQKNAIVKKMAEIRAKQELERQQKMQQTISTSTKTVDGISA